MKYNSALRRLKTGQVMVRIGDLTHAIYCSYKDETTTELHLINAAKDDTDKDDWEICDIR